MVASWYSSSRRADTHASQSSEVRGHSGARRNLGRSARPAALVVVLGAIALWIAAGPSSALAGDSSISPLSADPKSPHDREIQEIRQEIEHLEQKVDQLQKEDQQLQKTNTELKAKDSQLETNTNQQIQTLQSNVASATSPESFAESMNQYLGRYRFTIAGGVAGSFIYDRQSEINTFNIAMEPILLWQISDKMLFEGTVEAALPAGSAADFELPVATIQYFVNDYMELVAGIFDQPFGDWYEDQSPFWVNRFITAPLPFGVNALIPPTDVGLQLRGGMQWGKLGQIADYTLWMANGPGYTQSSCTGNTPPSPLPTCNSSPLVGDTLVSVNNIHLNTHTPAFGARFRVYPLPVDSTLGRLELGASTYDGKWLNGLWFNAWGVDFNYFKDNFQARGEWMQTYRQMPNGMSADNRQGWYVQGGYFLTGLSPAILPLPVQGVIDKLEPLVRYSGINQRAAVQSEILTNPSIGFSGSPAVFAPHAREVALGLDYWFAPSVVWQNEFDLELPRAGGFYSDTGAPVGATRNDRAFLSQIAIGF